MVQLEQLSIHSIKLCGKDSRESDNYSDGSFRTEGVQETDGEEVEMGGAKRTRSTVCVFIA